MDPILSELDDSTLQALGDLGASDNALGQSDYFGVAYRVARGARDETQDVPFAFHLAQTDNGYVHFAPDLHRRAGHWERDVVVVGIIDGMGGASVSLKVDKGMALAPLFDSAGLISPQFKGSVGDYLTGYAAARFLFHALSRRVTQLRHDALDYSLVRLINTVNLALYELNQLLFERDYADRPKTGGIGAAMTIAIIGRDGAVQYANCGDCRAGIIRDSDSGPEVEELSSKQTVASMQSVGDRTTVGLDDDNRILNPLGLSAKIQPALKTSTLGVGDTFIQLTDGTKEALMYNAVLREFRWDERTLEKTFRHVIVPYLQVAARSFPLVHQVFENAVRPHLATNPRDHAGTVFDNASMLIVRRATGGDAAMDALYQAIDRGDTTVSRSPFRASEQELRRIAALAGILEEHELGRFFEMARGCGLDLHSALDDAATG